MCKKGVTKKTGGIACERCLKWYHVVCVFGALQVTMDLLSHKNLVFLCDECVDAWKDDDDEKDKEDKCSQTETDEVKTTEARTQTEERTTMPET